MNKQREIIYAERRRVLSGENLQDQIQMMMRDVITESVALYTDERKNLITLVTGLICIESTCQVG